MRIAVVGATGRIGAPLTLELLKAGHHVKALSRGGPGLDALVRQGAEPILGSFDAGTGAIDTFFDDADAAFLMVKTDWDDLHGHYPKVARRFVTALRGSSVRRVVSLSAIGSDVNGDTGHFKGFHDLDETLNELSDVSLVHLRAGWFMENLLAWTGAVARHDRIAWSLDPDIELSWVATADIATQAAKALQAFERLHREIVELGSEDLTMPEVATLIGRVIGRPVEYALLDRDRREMEEGFMARGGTSDRWSDDSRTLEALNNRVVRFHGLRPPLPTTMEAFLRNTWEPRYRDALVALVGQDDFFTWSSAPNRFRPSPEETGRRET